MDVLGLSIFDWLLWDNIPCQVTAIGCDYIETTKCGITLAESHLLQGIPLTPKILEKNGFDVSDKEVMQYHFEEDGEKYHFSLRQMYDKDGKPHGYSFYAFNVLTLLDYVHELQHALRLCGIDKEIEI